MTKSLAFDTNILIYFVDSTDAAKHAIAKQIIDRCYHAGSPVALQCLTEFYRASTRKKLLAPELAALAVHQTRTAMKVIPPSADDLAEAMAAHRQHNLAFWDAMLCATVRRAGCTVLFSEDFQNGRAWGTLTIRNPFALSAEELRELLS